MEMKGGDNISFLLTTSTLFFLISLSFSSQETIGTTSPSENSRQTLEIIIGVGSSPPAYPPDNGECPDCMPTPEPAACPEPPPPPPLPPSSEPKCPPPVVPPSPPPPPPPPEPAACPEPPPPLPPPSEPECPPPVVPPSPPPPPPPEPAACPEPPPPAPPPSEPECPPSVVPPSPPPSPPPPRPFPGPPDILPTNLKSAIRVIQKFKKRITHDPKGITKTWKGRICYDESKYEGFYCYRRDGEKNYRIAGVKFNGFRFDGQLAVKDFIENLSKDLVFFHVNSNNFTGDIPFEITKLPRFYELDLSNNKFTGAFPKPVLAATNLTILDLRFNKFAGQVPPEVFALDLDILFLNNNEFSGNLPENLGKLPVLYLTLANNKFMLGPHGVQPIRDKGFFTPLYILMFAA